jgi:hypothetical protein
MKNHIDLNERGIKLWERGEWSRSYSLFERAWKLSKDPTILKNMALSKYSFGDYKSAVDLYNQAEKIGASPDFNKSLALLQMSDREGFRIYDRRIGKGGPDGVDFPNLPIKWLADLNELKGANLLVLNEQGFGDEFLFSVVLEKLNVVCESVYYQVYPENLDLFNEIYKFDKVKFFTERTLLVDFINKFNIWSSSGQLFALFNLSDRFFFEEVENKSETGRVGIFFRANTKSKNWKERSVDPKVFKPLSKRYDLVNLQKDFDLAGFENPKLESFLDTKRVIDSLDFVVTIDSSVANLAGMLGKETYLIMGNYLDWRYKFGFYESIEVIEVLDIKDLI